MDVLTDVNYAEQLRRNFSTASTKYSSRFAPSVLIKERSSMKPGNLMRNSGLKSNQQSVNVYGKLQSVNREKSTLYANEQGEISNTKSYNSSVPLDRSMRRVVNGSLTLIGAVHDYEGRYLCRASNGVGSDLSKVITITVHGKLKRSVYMMMTPFMVCVA